MKMLMPTIKELTSIKLLVSSLPPADVLILYGHRKGVKPDKVRVMGILDLSGEHKSWFSDEHELVEIHGTAESLEKFKEVMDARS
jgi:hypothetical protein